MQNISRGSCHKLVPARLRPLLNRRICDLPLKIAGTPLESEVRRLYRNLASAGLEHFRPVVYLGDEWFSPEGVSAIAVPFYLADTRLRSLEAALRRDVEGGTPEWCRKLLRHEAGHAFDHAYEISRSRKWRKRWLAIFGDPGTPYAPESYRIDPGSRNFVRHLPDHYAQAHPDEDFAETFAVCVTPHLDWRRRYKGCPVVLQKLQFMTELLRFYGVKRPKETEGPNFYQASRLRRTLGQHYKKLLS